MIPLSDIDRRPLRFPVITALIIAINVIMFLFELLMGDQFVLRLSFIPSEISAGKNLITILTAMFIHGSILHIAGNMLYFWAFGPEIEDAMGRLFYAAFYLSGGIIATLAQVIVNPHSTIPNLGASGAIASVMGAFLVTFPRDRIRTIIFLGWFFFIRFIPAVILVGFWFVLQLLNETISLVQVHTGGVAYMAHVAGFVYGMSSARLFDSRKRQPRHDE